MADGFEGGEVARSESEVVGGIVGGDAAACAAFKG